MVSEIDALVESEAYPLRVRETGYIQFIDPEIILNLAKEKDLFIRLLRKPGQFVMSGEVAALVWPADKVDERLAKHLRRGVQIGNQRTPTQDVEYAINQLVEIAVRAMSPAINDPFTAMTCLDYLADGLAKYVRYGESSPNFYDKDGRLRLIFEPARSGRSCWARLLTCCATPAVTMPVFCWPCWTPSTTLARRRNRPRCARNCCAMFIWCRRKARLAP